mgnify:FL=1
MSAFWNKKEEGKEAIAKKQAANQVQTKVEKEALSKDKKSKKKDKKSKPERKLTAVQADLVNRILRRPRISEDTMNKQAEGKYVFEVSSSANKNEVSKAIIALYGVDVEKVNIMNYSKQNKKFRGHTGQTKAFKKAIVSIKKGQSIELFKEAK